MNARQFNFSFNEVEPANDFQCLNVQQNMKKWRTIRWGAAALAACLCVIVLVIVLPSLNHYTPQLQPSSASDNQNNVSPFEIAVGAEDDAKGKPTNPQHLSAATLSFCQGNNVSVTLGMGDLYSMHQACGGLPVLDTYGENGYPLLRVYEANPNQHTNGFLPEQPDSRLTINGVAGAGYEKIFLKNELNELDISIQEVDGTGWRISNPEAWHHETLEIGFQEIEVNTSGTIIILFGWYFEHDNPSNAQESNHSIMGIARQLSYYKGEKGIGLSCAGTEDAEGNYLAAVKREFVRSFPNMTCAAKPMYIIGDSEDTIQFPKTALYAKHRL